MNLREAMPALVAHEGEWEGIYRHVGHDFTLIDQHHMHTRCEFPADRPDAYLQHNRLWWDDGRTVERSFGGVYRDGLIHWDTDHFSGYGWQTHEGVVMLRLDRKDEPGVHFIEMITLAGDGRTRARVWQWFRDGTPFRRTLCDEWRV